MSPQAPNKEKNIKQEAVDSLIYLPKEEQEKVVEYIDGLIKLEKLKNEKRTSK